MLISLEGQMMCSGQKTGIGRYAACIADKILNKDKENLFELVYFDFFGRNKSKEKLESLFKQRGNIRLKSCGYMPYGVYARYHGYMKFLSYNFLTGSNADLFHFFNAVIPSRIKGKTISTVHDMVYVNYPETMNSVNYNIHRRYLSESCRRADVIVTVSQNSKMEISEFMKVPEEKIYVTYNGVDRTVFFPQKNLDYIRQKYRIKGEYVLYLGTLEPRKNVGSIIKAFKILSEKNGDISLVLAGGKGWMYKDIFSLVKELGLSDRVVFPGYIEEKDVPVLYSSACVFVFPSLYEGFGIPPLEAMACGTPVIVSNTSSLPEVAGDAGMLVDPYDTEMMAWYMEKLIIDTELHREYSQKGLMRAEKFTWDNAADVVLGIYKSLG